jgi:hypothetical protein
LCLEQTRLKVDNVVAELVVLGLEVLVQFAQLFELLDLVLEFADIFLFPLAECALTGSVMSSLNITIDVLGQLGFVPRAWMSTALSDPCAPRRRHWGRSGSCSAVNRQWLGRCAAVARRYVAAAVG